jgi:hypothetical protein
MANTAAREIGKMLRQSEGLVDRDLQRFMKRLVDSAKGSLNCALTPWSMDVLFTVSCAFPGNNCCPTPYLGYTKNAADIVKPTLRALD